MSRWLTLLAVAACVATAAGCGSAVVPGLANGPRLGGSTTADDRIHDVVANGDDACGTLAEHGVLRNRFPPCPAPGHTRIGIASSSISEDATRSSRSGGLVQPWLDHFYVGWPCSSSTGVVSSRALMMSGPTDATRASWSPEAPAGAVCLH